MTVQGNGILSHDYGSDLTLNSVGPLTQNGSASFNNVTLSGRRPGVSEPGAA